MAATSQSLIGQSKTVLDTPALLVDLDILEANIARIAKTCRDNGVGRRPHTKAHKTPEIAQLQLAAGAIGIACAKLGEAEVMAAAGIRDIFIVNQIVGAAKVRRLVALIGPPADRRCRLRRESRRARRRRAGPGGKRSTS